MDWKKQVEDFKKSMKIEETGITPQAMRFGFFGSVGSGKSVTGGILAMAITPTGFIGWVDGENHRSGWAIDSVAKMAAERYPGTTVEQHKARFKVMYLEPPFHPLRLLAALETLEQAGCKTTILDAVAQCWDSDGGYLDLKNDELDRMAGDDEGKRARSLAAAAAHVKPWTHSKMVNRINNSTGSIIMLIQAKKKFDMATKAPAAYESPIQESGLTRTAIAVAAVEADQDGKGGLCDFTNLRAGCKFTHSDLLALLPKKGDRFTFAHGEAVLQWCQTPQGPGTKQPPTAAPAATTTAPADPLKALKAKLWALLKPIEAGDAKTWGTRTAWMRANAVLGEAEEVKNLTEGALLFAIEETTKKLATQPAT